MVTTTVVITVTRTLCIALRGPAQQTVSGAPTTDAYRLRGIAMATTTVATGRMNHQSTASRRAERVSAIYSRATTAIAYRGFTSVMAITIA